MESYDRPRLAPSNPKRRPRLLVDAVGVDNRLQQPGFVGINNNDPFFVPRAVSRNQRLRLATISAGPPKHKPGGAVIVLRLGELRLRR